MSPGRWCWSIRRPGWSRRSATARAGVAAGDLPQRRLLRPTSRPPGRGRGPRLWRHDLLHRRRGDPRLRADAGRGAGSRGRRRADQGGGGRAAAFRSIPRFPESTRSTRRCSPVRSGSRTGSSARRTPSSSLPAGLTAAPAAPAFPRGWRCCAPAASWPPARPSSRVDHRHRVPQRGGGNGCCRRGPGRDPRDLRPGLAHRRLAIRRRPGGPLPLRLSPRRHLVP